MVKESGHDFAVDWWAVGIIIYELLIGITPFFNKQRQRMNQKILCCDVVWPDKNRYIIEYSDEFVDIVHQLLKKDRKERLGSAGGKFGYKDVLAHPWFADIDIKAIESQQMAPPFKPNFDTEVFEKEINKLKENPFENLNSYIKPSRKKIVDDNADLFDDFDTRLKKNE